MTIILYQVQQIDLEMTERKSLKVMLHPTDEEERKRFKAFRNEDVFSMFTFVAILASFEVFLLTVVMIHSLFTGIDVEFTLINFLY